MLTGARLNEIAGLRWGEVDLEHKLLTIPPTRFKTGQRHDIPLSPDAVALLRALPRFRRGDALFSFDFGANPVAGFSKPKASIDRRLLRTLRALARARGDDAADVKLAGWTNHDIRRTVRSRLSALRVEDRVAELVIGHQRKGIVAIYDQFQFEGEKREALTKWAALLRSIVRPAPEDKRKVVKLPRRGA
jgi:integrase